MVTSRNQRLPIKGTLGKRLREERQKREKQKGDKVEVTDIERKKKILIRLKWPSDQLTIQRGHLWNGLQYLK